MKVSKSTILTCLGALGVVATAVLAVRATPEAVELIDEATEEKNMKAIYSHECVSGELLLTPWEVVKTTWKCYIPSVLVGATTITCIFGANALNKKQQAALTSAYALLAEAHKEYRKKTTEMYGQEADHKICKAVNEEVELEEGETYLFYDASGLGYFESPVKHVVMDDGLECYILDIDPADS